MKESVHVSLGYIDENQTGQVMTFPLYERNTYQSEGFITCCALGVVSKVLLMCFCRSKLLTNDDVQTAGKCCQTTSMTSRCLAHAFSMMEKVTDANASLPDDV